jgi:NADPH-dependent 2,4-dienoyl-CoA reductase/sulfur reductase-like enzyme
MSTTRSSLERHHASVHKALLVLMVLWPGFTGAAPGPELPGLHYFQGVQRAKPRQVSFDVAVYGGTPAGVTAAIQCARMGKQTVLLSFNRFVGGLSSAGLTDTDVGSSSVIRIGRSMALSLAWHGC